MNIINDRADDANKSALKSGGAGTVYAIELTKDMANVISDPGTVIYFNQNGTDGVNTPIFILEGQGMNTYKLTGLYLKALQNSDGSYFLYGTQSGQSRYLWDDKETGAVGVAGSKTIPGNQGHWNVLPINQTDNYFAILPDVTAGNKYYTTMYASFPFKLGNGMKAYYVKTYNVGDNISEPIAELTELKDGIVPASCPVIIECASANTADNIVEPLVSTSATASGNILKGNYFGYVKVSPVSGKESTTDAAQELKNAITYDAATMRILGETDGKLCFKKAEESQLVLGKYLPANKAYIDFKGVAGASASATWLNNIVLLDAETYKTGIQDISTKSTSTKKGVYSLAGIRVSERTENLPAGVYIVDGKKIVKK